MGRASSMSRIMSACGPVAHFLLARRPPRTQEARLNRLHMPKSTLVSAGQELASCFHRLFCAIPPTLWAAGGSNRPFPERPLVFHAATRSSKRTGAVRRASLSLRCPAQPVLRSGGREVGSTEARPCRQLRTIRRAGGTGATHGACRLATACSKTGRPLLPGRETRPNASSRRSSRSDKVEKKTVACLPRYNAGHRPLASLILITRLPRAVLGDVELSHASEAPGVHENPLPFDRDNGHQRALGREGKPGTVPPARAPPRSQPPKAPSRRPRLPAVPRPPTPARLSVRASRVPSVEP